MNNLSERLKSLANYVEEDSRIIDIGCDHAYLDIYLMQHKKNIFLIASDINEKALNNAKQNIKKYNLDNKIDVRLGNGLDIVNNDEIDTIIMSGLGTHKIVGVLVNNINKLKNVKQIIIQSNTNIEFLRKKVISLKYYIASEELVKENNIIYTIIDFRKGKRRYTKKDIYFGPILIKENSDLFKEKNKEDLAKLEVLLKLIPRNNYFYRYKVLKKIKLYKKYLYKK